MLPACFPEVHVQIRGVHPKPPMGWFFHGFSETTPGGATGSFGWGASDLSLDEFEVSKKKTEGHDPNVPCWGNKPLWPGLFGFKIKPCQCQIM